MWLLGRSLPAMVGHLVPEEDEHWQNLTLLLRIVDYLLAPRLTPDEADYVQVLIGDHHTMYKSLYPDESIPPKFYYLVHMPRVSSYSVHATLSLRAFHGRTCTCRFGPLVRHWTMRFEALQEVGCSARKLH